MSFSIASASTSESVVMHSWPAETVDKAGSLPKQRASLITITNRAHARVSRQLGHDRPKPCNPGGTMAV